MNRPDSFTKVAWFILMLVSIISCEKNDPDSGPDTDGDIPIQINSIDPSSGTKGTVVTIYGTGFSNEIQDVTVLLNGKQMVVTQAYETQIKFIVPPKAGSGLIGVVVNGRAASGPMFEFIYSVTVTTIAGTPGTAGFADGIFAFARFNYPRGITLDSQGNLYIADEMNHRIRRISPGGTVVTFAGLGIAGHADGVSSVARFNSPHDIDLDEINGFFYVADKSNHCIRRISLSGNVTTAAGIPGSPGFVNAPGLSARLNNPTGVAVEGESVNVYIADGGNHCIRKFDPFEVVTTFAGSSTDGQQDGIGTAAKFSSPYDISWDSSGYLFVTDKVNQNVRRIKKSNAEVLTIAGNGVEGFNDGPGHVAWFNEPAGVCSWYNDVIIADYDNHRIRKISPSKNVTTIAGDGTDAHLDGAGLIAKFFHPGGIVRTKEGDFFISDTENHCIRKMVVD